MGAHRRQVRAARNKADIRSRLRQLHTEIAADRAGAVDTDFHAVLQNDWPETASFTDALIPSARRSAFFQDAPAKEKRECRRSPSQRSWIQHLLFRRR